MKLNENVENSTQSLQKTKEDVKLITNKTKKIRRLVKTYILKRNTRCFHQKRFSMPIISRRGYIKRSSSLAISFDKDTFTRHGTNFQPPKTFDWTYRSLETVRCFRFDHTKRTNQVKF